MQVLRSLVEAEQFIFSRLGKNVSLATPLGLGKPNQLINLIYEKAKKEKDIQLKIFTALSLDFAEPKTELEKRFLGPFYARHFGEDYPHLAYVRDLQRDQVPRNISVHEFYFQAGAMSGSARAQAEYISLNYTHVARAILQHGINLIVQMIAKGPDGAYSLSSNPDLSLDVADLYNQNNRPLLKVAVVHPDLPFLGGDAEVAGDFFDVIVETPEVRHELFGLPKTSENIYEHLIGVYASQLVEDDGTLQIGIGSLSDALVHAMILRHRQNADYRKIVNELWQRHRPAEIGLHTEPFEKGLYGTSEMLMDGFMHLRQAGILKRLILDHDEARKRYLHGAFFLGSRDFYNWLRNLSEEDYKGLSMTRVSKVNDLYDPHEMALRRQRKKARFFNTCMSVTLLGGAASDTLDDGQVISGVGGQFNFVAMAHELADARSILMLRSTREKKGKRYSNIVPHRSALTVPRHLRDVVITEYGIAFLKGESDEVVIQRLVEIADSEFQPELIAWAKKQKKISAAYELPPWARDNTPEALRRWARPHKELFPLYPFGSDFTPEEIILGKGLLQLKEATALQKLGTLLKGTLRSPQKYGPLLKRLQLQSPASVKEWIYQKVVLGALSED